MKTECPTDAGALLLREVDRQIGLTRALADCIPDPRNPALFLHQQSTMLTQRVLGPACGYEDLNDHQTLRNDPCFQILSDRLADPEHPLASPPPSGGWKIGRTKRLWLE
jgi:hypothetical protein